MNTLKLKTVKKENKIYFNIGEIDIIKKINLNIGINKMHYKRKERFFKVLKILRLIIFCKRKISNKRKFTWLKLFRKSNFLNLKIALEQLKLKKVN